jgi:hypothetical protein
VRPSRKDNVVRLASCCCRMLPICGGKKWEISGYNMALLRPFLIAAHGFFCAAEIAA